MKQVLVVGLGGDIGVYTFQRAAHEKYGWQSIVLSRVRTTFLKHSTLSEWIIEPNIQEPAVLVRSLNQIAADHPHHELILFTNTDWNIRTIAQHRDQLDPRWLQPLCDLATFERVSSKTAFARICDTVGVRTPFTIAVGFTHADAPATDSARATTASGTLTTAQALERIRERGLEYPLIGKPSTSADWFNVAFPGKKKIHHFASEAELVEVLDELTARSYPSEFLVQEFVPGDETHMRSLTAYRDAAGEVTLLAGGQVLLEEHTPGTLGIPAAILTETDAAAFDDARRVLEAADYYGFANFDYKISSRDGGRVFFEANPRVGRNNHYVTAAGVNIADAVARDLLPDHFAAAHHNPDDPVPASPTEQVLYSVVPYRMLLRYLTEPALRQRVVAAKKRAGVFHPLVYSGDRSLLRRLYVRALDVRMALRFRKYYPQATDSGF